MKLTSTVIYKAAPEKVIEALLSEELAQARSQALGLTETNHKQEGNSAVTEVVVPADKLPSKARNFAKNGVHATITTRVEDTHVNYSVDPHGLPVEVRASLDLSGHDTTTATISGELKVKIPLIGSAVEKRAASFLDRFLAKDAALVEKVVNNS